MNRKKPSKSQRELLSSLATDSLRISTATRKVHMDSLDNPEVERTYLTISGTPAGYRWLAALLNQQAESAESQPAENGTSIIVDPNDLSKRPITMTEWSAVDLVCDMR